MKIRASSYRVLAPVQRYSDAAVRLHDSGDCVVVERGGVRRQLVLQCPDGCGEVLSINLDPRSGPAWRLYHRRGHWSLFPSIDKSSGCLSHFILWRGRVLWCDGRGDGAEPEIFADLGDRVMEVLRGRAAAGFVEIAERLDEVPWDVLGVCRHLVRVGLLDEKPGEPRGIFFIRKSGEARKK
jgi:hypothetical protein